MKINEIVQAVRAENPELLAGVKEKDLVAFLRASLAVIGRGVDNTAEGRFLVAGLGAFNVKHFDSAKVPGEKVRRVLFSLPKK